MAIELVLSASGNLVQAFLFAFVGFAMARRLRRLASPPGAARAFVLWWYLMATQGLLVALMDVGVAAGWLDNVRGYQVLHWLNILVASAQIWALGYYLVYLWTGIDRKPQLWIGVFAVAYFLYFFILAVVARPVRISVGTWTTGLDLGLSTTQVAILGVLFFLPIFALLAGYFLLAFELRGERQRVRVIVLGVVAALWNLSLVDRFATDASEPAPFLGFIMVLNLIWVVILYFVYFPPVWMRRRLAPSPSPAKPEVITVSGETDEPEGAEASGAHRESTTAAESG